MLLAAVRAVTHLTILPGRQFHVPRPRTWSAVSSHEAAGRLDFRHDISEFELLNLGFDLSRRFIGQRRFAEVRFAVPPPDIKAWSLFCDEAGQHF